jgi:hypothetical protein
MTSSWIGFIIKKSKLVLATVFEGEMLDDANFEATARL